MTSLALSSVLVGAGSAAFAFAFAFASVSLARASLPRRLISASLLPLATRPGFLAGLVFGGSAVTLAGAGAGVGASGIVLSGCEVMVSILMCQISFRFLSDFFQVPVRFLLGSCQVPVRFLSGSCQVPVRFLSGFTLHQVLRVDNLLHLC